ncbi:Alpha amylase family and Glycosyl hydrolase, family 13, catalytic domain and Alpha-amylase, C-terminal all beta domain and Glycosyl hydrolase, family 13, subfamily, catalytic domain and Glycosyl hydrolase, family 13, all-beta domain and Glycoside hydrolase, catalytic domain and Glycoside hydrolase, superfamily domain-containing protein [Strongyloides ratti]|uniref:Alpha-amylase n=1 Tax=Strongyloides ratti TaxID=34506 RepID=A0A090LGP5_STRRB|nr:Alpha amylase family and Glycosyl hydrolase, family 13, catalytic domain and Alpha-amylase, C-terminal all beta domain and Glycosyl hydrolase, family 13, subfamily, catalytic domain and Glycosyl hydrolase, family 13, all-beta domain and Glycoside hydrolase, catalytic domain and Glycoside hydrolase, superfamily domain-containing protein [Strongyloides ratti]CEF68947.1 Alpha amylase family and Glycosyl hydrolase, family 13, catalytic domain and Alpha-amylase, C-terminal all beta domain and Glycos
MKKSSNKFTYFLTFLILISYTSSYNFYWYDELFTDDKQIIVHLFEWKWTDIANECETFLSKYGYGAVQISPPMEHITIPSKQMPWWIRYQPVSYKLNSRSGTESEFKNMVDRCNKVGVKIIVDVVLNHMTGVAQKYGVDGIGSSGGTPFDATNGIESFPGVPYTKDNTNDPRCNHDIQQGDYSGSAYHVKECRLSGLIDLNQNDTYVQGKIVDYLNGLIDAGVAGFRCDASKHMWPNDILTILNKVKNLRQDIFGSNKRPIAIHEVIDQGGEAVKCSDYIGLGRYTDFNYGSAVGRAAKKQLDWSQLAKLGPGFNYGNNEDNDILAFIENHDNERSYNPSVATYKDGDAYKRAVAFMLAWPYGLPRVMSSYYFNSHDQGPPNAGSNNNYATTSPTFDSSTQTCQQSSGWVCQHRWPEIRKMTLFRKSTNGAAVSNIQTSNNIIAFARTNKGYFALNGANNQYTFTSVQTTLPVGVYCDIYNGELTEDGCSGKKITVLSSGKATFSLEAGQVIAFTIDSRIGNGKLPPKNIPSTYKLTAILLKRQTYMGQNLFVRGGHTNGITCTSTDYSQSNDPCAVPIIHSLNASFFYNEYLSWRQNDNYFDWHGPEITQGTHDGSVSFGTPLIWTTNDISDPQYQPVNKYGSGYWMTQFYMECDKLSNGWFELKGYEDSGIGWEGDINQSTCTGSVGGTASYTTNNHMGKCGSVNVFEWDSNSCIIDSF